MLLKKPDVGNRTDTAFRYFYFTGGNLFSHPQASVNIYFKCFQVAVIDAYQLCFIANMLQFLFGMQFEQHFQL